jgi:lipid-binding SYLF domain-containing protein
MKRFLLAALALATCAAPAAAMPPARTLEDADAVLADLAAVPLKGIPPRLLSEAEGVVIAPHVVKLGFFVGVRGGRGVVLTRDRSGNWGEPVFVQFGGASVGFQAGVESTDVVLVFRTRRGLDRVLAGKEKFTLGVDAAVAAGPVGRDAMAATDAQLKAEVLSYSRSRGLFAGVALDGSALDPDPAANAEYQKGDPAAKAAAEQLKARLAATSTARPAPGAQPVPYPPAVLEPPVRPRPSMRPWRRPFRPAATPERG